jgi:hypothetical protein
MSQKTQSNRVKNLSLGGAVLTALVTALVGACSSQSPVSKPPVSAADYKLPPVSKPPVSEADTKLLTSAKLSDLSESLDAIRSEFNAHKHEARFLTLLSPTCPACQSGARGVRKSVLDNPATKSLATMIVWIPMLDADELPAAVEGSARFRDLPVPQFWDGTQKLA